jgi:hypothetical protein
MNDWSSSEDSVLFTKADERFFYIKMSGKNIAFEAKQNKISTGNLIGSLFVK